MIYVTTSVVVVNIYKCILRCGHAQLNENQINSFDDIDNIKSTCLQTIYLERNPHPTVG